MRVIHIFLIMVGVAFLGLCLYLYLDAEHAMSESWFWTLFILAAVISGSAAWHYGSVLVQTTTVTREFCDQTHPFEAKLLQENSTITIVPYCTEKPPAPWLGEIDQVNKRELGSAARQAFHRSGVHLTIPAKFTAQFTNYSENTKPLRDTTSANPQKFVQEVVLEYFASLPPETKHVWVASHSKFMSALFQHLADVVKLDPAPPSEHFENLDILQIVVKKPSSAAAAEDTKPRVVHYQRISWDQYMRKKQADQPPTVKLYDVPDANSYLVVTVMRHCKGCHNATSAKVNKLFQMLESQSGYLGETNCIPHIFKTQVPADTFSSTEKNTFARQYILKYGMPSHFCASVSLRAIFTSAAIQKHISTTHTKPGNTTF